MEILIREGYQALQSLTGLSLSQLSFKAMLIYINTSEHLALLFLLSPPSDIQEVGPELLSSELLYRIVSRVIVSDFPSDTGDKVTRHVQ